MDTVKKNVVEIGKLVDELTVLLLEDKEFVEEEVNFMKMATHQIKDELDKLKTYFTAERYKVHGPADKH